MYGLILFVDVHIFDSKVCCFLCHGDTIPLLFVDAHMFDGKICCFACH